MSSNDQSQRFLFRECAIRGELVGLQESYQEVLSKHSYPAQIQLLLGEFLAASALLSSTLKFDGTITLQFQGKESIKLLMAECTNQSNLRGIARWDQGANPTSDDLVNGLLTITIEPKKGERYQGIVSFEQESLSAALENYFQQSEQIRTRIWLSADGEVASGMILQALPEHASQGSLEIESEQWNHLLTLAETLSQEELLTLTNNDLLYRLFHQETVELFEPKPLQFACSCSWERSSNALLSLGEEDAQQLLTEQEGKISIACEFCGASYEYDQSSVDKLLSKTRH